MSYNLTGAAYGGNITLGKAGLGAGTTSTYTIATAVTYALKGQLFTLAAGANVASPTIDQGTKKAFVPLQANQTCIFAFYVNAAGAVSVAQGVPVNTLEFTGGLAAAQFPQGDDTVTPFAYALVSASSALAAPWTFGASNFAGVTGLTAVFRDIMDYPAQPIVG